MFQTFKKNDMFLKIKNEASVVLLKVIGLRFSTCGGGGKNLRSEVSEANGGARPYGRGSRLGPGAKSPGGVEGEKPLKLQGFPAFSCFFRGKICIRFVLK